MLAELPPPREVDQELTPKGVTVEFVDVKPGAFVRAVLAAMCSVSSNWDLAERHLETRAIVLEGEARELPSELSLYLGLYLGPKSRLVGPQLCADRTTGDWSWLIEVSHPPLASLMRLSGSKEPDLGLLDISDWTKYPPDAEANLEATFLVGFGWSPYPGDYRSSARIIRDGDNESKPRGDR